MRISLALSGTILVAALAAGNASSIDFETVPGVGPAVDQMQINSQYYFSDGVCFRLEEGGFPFIAQRGSPLTAFNAPGGADEPVAAANVGDSFLTNSKAIGGSATTLLIEFAGPVQDVSGVILDIDAGDTWNVEAWGGGVLRDSSVHQDTDPDAGDGVATPWSFSRLSADIDFVRLEHTAGPSVGGAWDNLVYSPVTLPSLPSDGVIDFESIPCLATPTDRLEISNPFQASHGIVFRLEDGSFPELALVGAPETAFAGPPNNAGSDNPITDPDQGIGTAFLTDDGTLAGLNPSPLIVEYDPPTAAASGVVLDIDFDESFTIDARDDQGGILETLVISAGDTGTGDGLATGWSIKRDAADIHSIRFEGSRMAAGGFGLGFDLFKARAAATLVPALGPVGWTLLALLLGSLGWRWRA